MTDLEKLYWKTSGCKTVVWMPLKPNTFKVSLPKVAMTANTFTMSMLCVPLKPNTFNVSFPEMIMVANVFTSQKHQIPTKKKRPTKLWRVKKN